MSVTNTKVWKFVSSVKFALFNLLTLAIVSVAGTIVQQNESHQYYIDVWGESASRIIFMLNLDDMFNTDWYIFLLGMFSVNLLFCTIDRLPNVLRVVQQDPSQKSFENIAKRSVISEVLISGPPQNVIEKITRYLHRQKWSKVSTRIDNGNSYLISAHKGSWTRLAVYIVHAGVLIVLAGAIVGKIYGFKTAVMIPEGPLVEDQLFNAPVPIPFEMRCDWFSIDYYDNGAPKQYRSEIALIKNGTQVLTETLAVNDPVLYDGITLYQETYAVIENEYSLQATNLDTNEKKVFQVHPHMQNNWQEENIIFGIITTSKDPSAADDHEHGPGNTRFQLAFSKQNSKPQILWVAENIPSQLELQGARYEVVAKQRYRTGLQVVKDPGVWIVYLGFVFMLFGLYAAFFLSHRQIWISVMPTEQGNRILFRGSAHKNKQTYKRQLTKLAEDFQTNQ
jgi:cytochrome c biogenesis protein